MNTQTPAEDGGFFIKAVIDVFSPAPRQAHFKKIKISRRTIKNRITIIPVADMNF